jgi:uncharacterized protein YdaU (DUF1376 family)
VVRCDASMPRLKIDRGRGFLFYPDDYLSDPAVLKMTLLGRGAYGGALLYNLWLQPEPGVVEDNDRLLAALALCSPEDWAQVKQEVAAAFDVTTRPGFWIQKRMVAEHQAQCRWIKAKSKAGKASAKARWGTGLRASQMDNRPSNTSITDPVTKNAGSGSGSEVSRISPPTPSPEPPASRVPPSGAGRESSASPQENPNGHSPDRATDPDDLTPAEFFDQHFWPNYPRKKGRASARREWLRAVGVKGGDSRLANRIVDALLSVSRGDWRDREEKFIPYAHTWLAQHRWEDS